MDADFSEIKRMRHPGGDPMEASLMHGQRSDGILARR